jgi:hypothetical protein
MEKRVQPLLPGVSPEVPRPNVVFGSSRVIRRARFRAAVRDALDLMFLVGVDWLFLRWPYAHVPFLTRDDSLLLLVAVNVLLIAYLWIARAFPRWRARRVAATWCAIEQTRLTASLQSRARRSAERAPREAQAS